MLQRHRHVGRPNCADGSNWYYIVFFLIGIVGYFTVPTIAGWIIEAGGGMGNYSKNLVNRQNMPETKP